MIQEEFRPILEELEAGRSAVLHRTVDGVEYTRLFRPRERLILLGGGHIAQPLCRMAAMLDFDVTVVDDRAGTLPPRRASRKRRTPCATPSPRRSRRSNSGRETMSASSRAATVGTPTACGRSSPARCRRISA